MPSQRSHDPDAGSGDRHTPVMAERVAELLAPALDHRAPVLVDATVGLGGHTLAMLTAHPQLHVCGIDRDHAALDHARDRLAAAGVADRFTAAHGVYDAVAELVAEYDAVPADGVDAILFDLGVSSMQLDRADRGFSYATDAPLDMRMDTSTGITAAEVLRDYPEKDLVRLLRRYGEERFAVRIARAVVAHRRQDPIESSGQLVELIRQAVPAAAQRHGGHPAKRTFQALRIEVNDELGALRRAIPAALSILRPGGRMVVMSYQSLEDRIVKHAIAPLTVSSTPLDLPVELAGHEPTFRWLTRKAERASERELDANSRAAPARLRAAERVRGES